jgi:hypothetical protein
MKGIIVLKAQSSLRETIRGAQQQSNIDIMVVVTVDICGHRVGGGGQCFDLSPQRRVEGKGLQRVVVYLG